MSGRSYNSYVRPQDRDGNNHAAVGRGRPHQAYSRGHSRSSDFHDMRSRHRYDERDMNNSERRSDPYHASRSSDQPYASSHHRSYVPSLSQYASSSRDHSHLRNSSHSHERPRSPDRRHHSLQNNDNNNKYDQSRRPRNFGGRQPKDASYDHHPLASTNGVEMYRARSLMRSNDFQLRNNAENYDNISCGDRMNNMNSHHSHYHQPQSRYDHQKSTSNANHERRPLASRQDFSSYPRSSQQISWPAAPRFSNDHTIPELIRIAYSNLAAMRPSATAAFWNKVLKQMNGRNAPNPRLPNHREELGRHLDQIFDHTQNTLMLFSMKDLAQTIYSMAKIAEVLRKRGRRCGEDIDASLCGLSFASASRDKLHQFDARHLSNLAYAYALVGYVPEFEDGRDLFDHIATQAVERSVEFNAQDISNMVWAFATVNKPHALMLEALGDQVVAFKHLGDFKPQNLANTVWAFAKAGLSHPMLFEKVANHIVRLDILYGVEPQHLSITLWAYATAGIRHPILFEKVANRIIDLDSLDRFTPQHLSNTLWAYATASVHHPKLFEKVANHIVRLDTLYGFNPQALSITLRAYAKVGIHHPMLFEKVAIHVVGLDSLDQFNSQNLANTVWAYATAGFHHLQLFDKVANHIVRLDDLDRFISQNLSNTMWAYATAQVPNPKMFQKVAKAAIQRTKEFNYSQLVANLLWAYATMGIVEKQLFFSFVPTAANLIDSYTNQELANIAWAYAVADVDAPTLFNDVFINACVEKKDGFEIENFRQLHQWHLWQTKEKSHAGLPLELQKKCYEAFTSEDPRASKLQDDVVSQLSSISLEPQEEVLMASGYRIDALLEVNGNTVGVEVDGPSHFIGSSKSPLARTILKWRQVPSIDGIELLSVPYWEWDKLGKDEVKKQEYLRELLKL